MEVEPTNVKTQLKLNINTSQLAPGQREGKSFDEFLAAALRSPSAGQTGAGSETAAIDSCFPTGIDYRRALEDGTSVAIGEDAVRFDARPIVGPSFVPAASTEEALPGPADPPQVHLSATEVSFFEPALNRAIALAAPRVGPWFRHRAGPGLWCMRTPGRKAVSPRGRPSVRANRSRRLDSIDGSRKWAQPPRVKRRRQGPKCERTFRWPCSQMRFSSPSGAWTSPPMRRKREPRKRVACSPHQTWAGGACAS